MKVIKVKQKPFNPETVEILEPNIGNILEAQKITGEEASKTEQSLAMMSQTVKIDGKFLTYEEWQNLPFVFFLELTPELDAEAFGVSEEQLSSLLEMASDLKKSE